MYNRIPQLIAAFGTSATSRVFPESRILGDVEKPNVLDVTLETQLDETVAVKFGKLKSVDARAQVQAVAVLRDDVLDEPRFHHCTQRHVRVCRLYPGKIWTCDFHSFRQHCP